MTVVALLACGVGLGAAMVVSSFLVSPTPLADGLASLQHQPARDELAVASSWRTRTFGESWQSSSIGRRLLANTEADLSLCGVTSGEHLAERVVFALIGSLWAPVTASLIALGGVSVPFIIPVWVSLAMLPLGFMLPSLTLRSKAASRRRSFRHAFSSFLDIVSVSLAGGKGVEGALNDGATIGDGWAFAHIRRALHRSRLLGETPWRGLSRLGDELNVPELKELAASAELAGAEGARVRASIGAKARSLRLRGLTDIEAEAQSASERMSLPIVGLMLGFVVFLGYPAVIQVVHGL
jgi:Flp pilus assembly protein TadB